MFLSSSARNESGSEIGSEKLFAESGSTKMHDPEFVKHCQKLLLSSFLPDCPSFRLFSELQNTVACQCCEKQSFFVRMIEKNKKKSDSEKLDETSASAQECYCVICYVDRFCNVHTFQNHDDSETHYIFKEKGSSGSILYQSSSTIKRL
jgi:hypothetical protein